MATPAARTSFAAVPPEAADVLRPALPGLADEMIAAISAEVPDYARAMEGTFGDLVRLGVEVALNRFMDMVADPSVDVTRARDTYLNLGRGEFHSGRSLDALLAAYRVGARLAWRRFVEAGTAGGLQPGALYSLGEAIFAYIDEISAESADGYAEEQSAAAGESQRRRRRLVRLLAQDPPASQEAIRTAVAGRRLAAAAPGRGCSWRQRRRPLPAPRRAARRPAAASRCRARRSWSRSPLRLARRIGGSAIGGAAGGLACVFVPDPDAPGRRRQIKATLGDDDRVALGPTVPWHAASGEPAPAPPRRTGSRRPVPLVVAEDHLATLLLAADRGLAADLAASRLAPLDDLQPGPRARLTETLKAWLDRPGQVQAVAAELGVHPQTVRYRLKQLRELFGARLEDPDARFELSLALRVG